MTNNPNEGEAAIAFSVKKVNLYFELGSFLHKSSFLNSFVSSQLWNCTNRKKLSKRRKPGAVGRPRKESKNLVVSRALFYSATCLLAKKQKEENSWTHGQKWVLKKNRDPACCHHFWQENEGKALAEYRNFLVVHCYFYYYLEKKYGKFCKSFREIRQCKTFWQLHISNVEEPRVLLFEVDCGSVVFQRSEMNCLIM